MTVDKLWHDRWRRDFLKTATLWVASTVLAPKNSIIKNFTNSRNEIPYNIVSLSAPYEVVSSARRLRHWMMYLGDDLTDEKREFLSEEVMSKCQNHFNQRDAQPYRPELIAIEEASIRAQNDNRWKTLEAIMWVFLENRNTALKDDIQKFEEEYKLDSKIIITPPVSWGWERSICRGTYRPQVWFERQRMVFAVQYLENDPRKMWYYITHGDWHNKGLGHPISNVDCQNLYPDAYAAIRESWNTKYQTTMAAYSEDGTLDLFSTPDKSQWEYITDTWEILQMWSESENNLAAFVLWSDQLIASTNETYNITSNTEIFISDLKLRGNPNNNSIILKGQDVFGVESIDIHGIDGRKIIWKTYRNINTNQISIDLWYLVAWNYICYIKFHNGRRQALKF